MQLEITLSNAGYSGKRRFRIEPKKRCHKTYCINRKMKLRMKRKFSSEGKFEVEVDINIFVAASYGKEKMQYSSEM